MTGARHVSAKWKGEWISQTRERGRRIFERQGGGKMEQLWLTLEQHGEQEMRMANLKNPGAVLKEARKHKVELMPHRES